MGFRSVQLIQPKSLWINFIPFKKAKNLLNKIKFLSLDARTLTFDVRWFKIVSMMNFLHHHNGEDGEKILKKLVRVQKGRK